jgi:hypothetical protein
MNFEVTSKLYFWLVLIFVAGSLAMDIFVYAISPESFATFTGMLLVMAAFGLLARSGILIMFLIKRGPIKLFLYAWGATFFIGGAAGLLSLLLSDGPTTLHNILGKFVQISIALFIVLPASEVLRSIEAQDA